MNFHVMPWLNITNQMRYVKIQDIPKSIKRADLKDKMIQFIGKINGKVKAFEVHCE